VELWSGQSDHHLAPRTYLYLQAGIQTCLVYRMPDGFCPNLVVQFHSYPTTNLSKMERTLQERSVVIQSVEEWKLSTVLTAL